MPESNTLSSDFWCHTTTITHGTHNYISYHLLHALHALPYIVAVCCFSFFLPIDPLFNALEITAFRLRNYAFTVLLYAMLAWGICSNQPFDSYDLLINTHLHRMFHQFVFIAVVSSSWCFHLLSQRKIKIDELALRQHRCWSGMRKRRGREKELAATTTAFLHIVFFSLLFCQSLIFSQPIHKHECFYLQSPLLIFSYMGK